MIKNLCKSDANECPDRLNLCSHLNLYLSQWGHSEVAVRITGRSVNITTRRSCAYIFTHTKHFLHNPTTAGQQVLLHSQKTAGECWQKCPVRLRHLQLCLALQICTTCFTQASLFWCLEHNEVEVTSEQHDEYCSLGSFSPPLSQNILCDSKCYKMLLIYCHTCISACMCSCACVCVCAACLYNIVHLCFHAIMYGHHYSYF